MKQKQLNDKKVWFIARLQAVITVVLFAMNLFYFNKTILLIFTVFTLLCGLNYLYYYLTRRYDHWSAMAMVLIALDFGYYILSGGNQGAGILWTLVFPFFAIYVRGYKQGTLISIVNLLALMAMVAIAYLFKVDLPYSTTFLLAFFLVNASMLVMLYQVDKGRYLIQEDYDRIENLFTHATDLLFIGNPTGHFLTVNPACTEVMGWSKEEWLIKNFLEFVHPDDKELSQQKIEELTGLNNSTFITLENRFQCKDGSYKWLSWRTAYDSHKKLVYAIARDITAEKVGEQQLRDMAQLQSIIVDVSADFLTSTPENVDVKIKTLIERVATFLDYERGYIIRLNRDVSATTGYYEWNSRGGIMSTSDGYQRHDLSDHTSLRSFLKDFDLLYVRKMDEFKDQSNWLKDMCLRYGIESLFMLPLVEKGQNVALLGFDTTGQAKELTEELIELLKVLGHLMYEVLLKNDVDLSLREAAGKLDDLNKTKDKLFSIIAHDLRSPLSTIIGFTEMMTDETSGYSIKTMQDYAKLMNQVAVNTFDLLENLLDWSRLQRGLLKPEPVELLVDELVNGAVNSYEHKAESRNLLVNIQVESGLKVEVDKRMLETVIRNLYTNALKFTPQGGVITIKAEKTRDCRLLLCVSDSGIGIPEPLLPVLFTVSEDKNRQGLGGERSSGLGLMLCKEFIELLNGTIDVQTAENKGSTFCINLPCQFNAASV